MQVPHHRHGTGRDAHVASDSGPLLFVLGLVVGLLVALLADRLTVSLADRDMELVRAVRNLAMEDFVGDVESDQLIDDALRGMMAGLDEYSRFYGPEELAQISRETSGEFRGIGVVFQDPRAGRVLFAFPGSPAARAGLTVGDRFVSIEGQAVDQMEPGGLQRSLQRPAGEHVGAIVESIDGARRTVLLEPEPVLDPTVRHARMVDAEEGIGYFAVLSFSHRTPDEFDDAIEFLRAQGMRRLIVDLRRNPGGILEASVRIANRFVPEGTIVATKTRTETEVTTAEPGEAHLEGLPLVLLIDENSASASEVLAGALQDHGAAALVGEATYGKGTVQTLRPFADERGMVKLTTATYYTPAWRAIERIDDGEDGSGIAPDLVVEIESEERRALYRFLDTYSPPASALEAITAWEEREGQELYARHPDDGQLAAARALLSGRAPGDAEPDADTGD